MLLQKNIVKKYLNLLSEEQTLKPWQQYQSYFLNEDIQANIHKIKEEQFQEGFLRELFVKVLGYTINPSPNYNLTTELKNDVGSKKADGAIMIDDKVIGVIELKDHKTPDLASIENQAFGYKSKHKDTRLVIISNFEKLRLYIDNAVEYREWDIFHMTLDEFREMYLCLAWQQVERGIALHVKQESVSNEDQITKALYKDYSQFKRVLFADILEQNPTPEGKDEKEWQLLLFKKTQKLLDRLLFIFFAEDGGLLPPNLIVKVIDQWVKLKDEFDEYKPFYDLLKKHFNYLNTGHNDIFAYNGGLFKPDEALDSIKISDDLLIEYTRKLSTYDFESDVDVNILGHIFENSLSEIEEVTQQINNGEAPQTSKRKQDGVFYTPQYITKYIVENTVGRLCDEKKKALNIVEDDYLSDQRRQLKTKQRLLDQLNQYRQWLLAITILDPACGSGAFLNAALQFLMVEHKQIDELEKKVLGYSLEFQDVENYILENNLFGVDINEESVEIAQLALWLRTAKPHRKLNTLSENIKCGNSLISDPAIAGEKAFDWQKEFPRVFENGGFDVVIGNPPYVSAATQMASESMAIQRKGIIDSGKYISLHQKWDLYIPFIELGIRYLCKDGGVCSMIVPYPLTNQLYGLKLRDMLISDYNLYELSDLRGTKVFEDATVTSTIFFVEKRTEKTEIAISSIMDASLKKRYAKTTDTLIQDTRTNVWNLDEVSKQANRHSQMNVLGDFCYISKGMVLNADEKTAKGAFKKEDLVSLTKDDIHCREYVEAKDIERYAVNRIRYLEYETERSPYQLSRPTFRELYTCPKILTNKIGALKVVLDTNNLLCDQTNRICVLWKDLKGVDNASINNSVKKFSQASRAQLEELSSSIEIRFLLVLLNSKYANYLLDSIRGSGNIDVNPEYIRNIPIPLIPLESQQPFVVLADTMVSLHQKLQDKRTRFLHRLTDNLEGVKITTALQQFDQLDFRGLIAELKKQKIRIPVKEQDEWEDFFNERVAECHKLSAQIKATDEEIDQRVFDLYGLTEEERKIVMEE
ncbi:MAG: N-6 DNA methylase [Prevotella sp.]|nr:N-6 DNA methylase [Prevotella sp.]